MLFWRGVVGPHRCPRRAGRPPFLGARCGKASTQAAQGRDPGREPRPAPARHGSERFGEHLQRHAVPIPALPRASHARLASCSAVVVVPLRGPALPFCCRRRSRRRRGLEGAHDRAGLISSRRRAAASAPRPRCWYPRHAAMPEPRPCAASGRGHGQASGPRASHRAPSAARARGLPGTAGLDRPPGPRRALPPDAAHDTAPGTSAPAGRRCLHARVDQAQPGGRAAVEAVRALPH